MSKCMDETVKRWTAKRKTALVIEIIQGKTSEKLFSFRPGVTVNIQYLPQAGANIGKAIMSANDFEWVGAIASVNPDHKSVTLDTGMSYPLDTTANGQSILIGLRVGDSGQLHLQAGQAGLVTSISGAQS